MNRKAFHQLLQRYVAGRCSDEEKRLIDQWYELLDEANLPNFTGDQIKEVEERLWNKIKNKAQLGAPVVMLEKQKSRFSIKWIKWAAASLIILLGAGIFYVTEKNKTLTKTAILSKKIEEGFLQEVNLTDTIKNIVLEDGSVVSLKPHSTIAIPRHFAAGKREVCLEGEAFFTVTKNPSRPFYVYNNDVTTKVLGTSFTVKAINQQVIVSVRTGKVAVFENTDQLKLNAEQKKANGVIITPNQKVTYYPEERHFITSIVEDPLPIPKETGSVDVQKFVFDDTPLSKVLSVLENEYGLEIIVENDVLNNTPFTGDITKQDLYNKLELICQAIQANYEIKGTRILIKRK
jgi:ferric-dicitrate binding protein FerR (iron transport regulator)